MLIEDILNNDNLHHAYLIEGENCEILSSLHGFLNKIGYKTSSNPDFIEIKVDSIKIDEARNIKSMSESKIYSNDPSAKKIFLISTNNLLIEAQNTLLKIFEEPASQTHYFFILPNIDGLLKTFVSRFYVIKDLTSTDKNLKNKEAENFIKMNLKERIDFIKEFIKEEDEEDISLDSARSRSVNFIDSLEYILYKNFLKDFKKNKPGFFDQLFKARKYLRQPGSSTKSLLESVALCIPIL